MMVNLMFYQLQGFLLNKKQREAAAASNSSSQGQFRSWYVPIEIITLMLTSLIPKSKYPPVSNDYASFCTTIRKQIPI